MTDLLLINLGMGAPGKPPFGYNRTIYRFEEDGFEQETVIAGLALWKHLAHLGRAPVSVRFAATREAWKGKEVPLKEEAARLGLDPEVLGPPLFVEIPRTAAGLRSVLPELEAWAEAHREGDSPPVLHMDLTHAWRAIPISQPWLALFLERLGFVEIGTMGYGAYVSDESPTPYIDISSVMGLAEWAAGVRDFERYGRAGTLRELMGKHSTEWTRKVYITGSARDAEQALGHLRALVGAAKALEAYLPAGLPVELGIAVKAALGDARSDEVSASVEQLIPGAKPLAERLHRAASRFAWRGSVPSKGKKKEHISLTREEIARQMDLVAYWTELGAVGEALRALRELMVNRVLLARAVSTGWLSRKERESAEGALNTLRPGKDNPCFPRLPASLRELGGLWHELCEARNGFAHAGMRTDPVKVEDEKGKVRRFLDRFRALDREDGLWRLQGPAESQDP